MDPIGSAAVGTILGFVGQIGGSVVDFFKQRQAHKFELDKMKFAHENQVQMHEITAQDNEHERLVQHDLGVNVWYKAAVRPALAMINSLVFYIMIGFLFFGWTPNEVQMEIVNAFIVMATAIFTFYFGSRAQEKARAWMGR